MPRGTRPQTLILDDLNVCLSLSLWLAEHCIRMNEEQRYHSLLCVVHKDLLGNRHLKVDYTKKENENIR